MEETIQKDQLSIRRAETEDTQYGTISDVNGAYIEEKADSALMLPWFTKALLAEEGEPVVEIKVPHRTQPFYVFVDEHILGNLIGESGIAEGLDDFVGTQVQYNVESGQTISIYGKEYVAYKRDDLKFTKSYISVERQINDLTYKQISDKFNRVRGTIKSARSDGDRLYFVVEIEETGERLVFNLEMSLFYDENSPAYKFVEEYGNGAVENLKNEDVYLQRSAVDSKNVNPIVSHKNWKIVSKEEPKQEGSFAYAVGVAAYMLLAMFSSFAAVSASISDLFFTAIMATMLSYYFFFKTLSMVGKYRKS